MNKTKRKWDRISETKRKSCVLEIVKFFEDERDEKIGMIAAEMILDLVLQSTSNEIYNKGIQDVKKELEKRFEDIKLDLELLLDIG